MATYNWVDLRIPEANLLADLNGILADLKRAQEFAHLLISIWDNKNSNRDLIEPLSIAMTITYARAFGGGVRYHLTDTDIGVLTDDQRAKHQFFRDYRDKHIAHSVNEFEENIVRATYCEETVKTEGITSIGFGSGRIIGFGKNDAVELINIATALEIHVQGLINQEQHRLLAFVRTIPIEEVLAGGQKIFDPSMANVAKRRK